MVQLAVLVDGEKSQCFLFDVLNKTKNDPSTMDDPMIPFLREILESDSVLKIIHDCRMDADALHHLLDIKLANVHDTSAWHYKLTGNQDVNLNDMLQSNGLKPNVVRDGEIYRTNHAFWATRPLKERMITWAAGDVSLMFKVHALQVDKATPTVARGRSRSPPSIWTWRDPPSSGGSRSGSTSGDSSDPGAATCAISSGPRTP